MKKLLDKQAVHCQNLLEEIDFQDGKPAIEALGTYDNTQFKRVSLKAGVELKCHQTSQHVAVMWLQGEADFQANGDTYAMRPGSLLQMPSGTPHGAQAKTDCVFLVVKLA